ncbi:DUF262 domain-containing protein [Lonepinella koalarum]|uniref:Uncharacterized protein DUF262 n=1 Tax=Lonepinella koalarum TaxID=53417 RepID=A0A4V2PUC8_9PAST|nr:DUF262 domain-containing protein [Lonepinella koalarum]MDH2927876.1 hypothetical protein [Lonepinella koalarum]TCK70071.1 uncharacterized protein DUF262 [Lonepinella koalarum]
MYKQQEILDEYDEVIENVVPPQDIFAFNESRSCADLKRMYDKKQIDISPDFQREQVWKLRDQTRFLDSLLKNLPIPSMCISLDISSQKRVVIDGLQRISTIVKFLDAVENDDEFQLSSLDDIDDRLSGMKIKQIKECFPEVISFIENVSIPVTVLRCDLSKKDHMDYIFTIFHRLNTGGVKLNNQEIRNCIFNGKLNNLLVNCAIDKYNEIKALLGSENSRFAFEEFILRFFAFQDEFSIYRGNLTKFLNDYMACYKMIDDEEFEKKKTLFSEVIDLVFANNIDHKKLSKVILEAILYGVAKNLEYLKNGANVDLSTRYETLISLEEFKTENLQGGLMQKQKVEARLNQANNVFGDSSQK